MTSGSRPPRQALQLLAVALRIGIENEGDEFSGRHGRQADRHGCLPGAALLADDRDRVHLTLSTCSRVDTATPSTLASAMRVAAGRDDREVYPVYRDRGSSWFRSRSRWRIDRSSASGARP